MPSTGDACLAGLLLSCLFDIFEFPLDLLVFCMSDLTDHFKKQRTAVTVADCREIEPAFLPPLNIDYMRLRNLQSTLPQSLNRLFDRHDFSVIVPELADASPLSAQVLRSMAEGGLDPEDFKYRLYVDSYRIVPCPPCSAHIDTQNGINLANYKQDVLDSRRVVRVLVSNLCPTPTLPNSKLMSKCPERWDRDLFFAAALAATNPGTFARNVQESPLQLPPSETTASFTAHMEETIKELTQTPAHWTIPDNGTPVCFNRINIHGFSGRSAKKSRAAVERYRLMLTIFPHQLY